MRDIAKTAARRAVEAEGFMLTRNGGELCLATNAVVGRKQNTIDASTYRHRVSSAGLGRRLEAEFWRWLDLVPSLRREPQTALALVVRYADYLEALERELALQREATPGEHEVAQLRQALTVLDAALWQAHRRRGLRWS